MEKLKFAEKPEKAFMPTVEETDILSCRRIVLISVYAFVFHFIRSRKHATQFPDLLYTLTKISHQLRHPGVGP